MENVINKKSLIFVTGGAGFIGSNLVRHLNKNGYYNIRVIDDLTDSRKFRNLVGCKFAYQDKDEFWQTISNGEIYKELPDYIFHLGAISSTSHKNGKELMEENTLKSIDLLMICYEQGIPIQYASSASVYGNSLGVKEEPLNAYAFSKLATDNFVRDLFYEVFYGGGQVAKPIAPIIGLRYFNCYDEKTEVLTSEGFKSIKDVTLHDRVATLNPVSDEIEYHNPTHIHKSLHTGDMIHFNGRRVDILCTPDQNLFVSTGKNRKFALKQAKDIVSENIYYGRFKQSAKWTGSNQLDYEIIPACKNSDNRKRKDHSERKIPLKLWLRFLGWFLSEGSVFSGKLKNGTEYYRVNISQIKNSKYIEEIYTICKEMGFNPQKTFKDGGKVSTGVTIHSKQLYLHLCKFSREKFIPNEVLTLSPSYLTCLFETLMKGDGNSDGKRYTTKYAKFADQFQELLLKIGLVGNVFVDKSGIYRISIARSTMPQIGNNTSKTVNCRIVEWNDFVYDITVKNHIFLSRRNGIVSWVGNCYGPGENHKDGQSSPILSFWRSIKETGKINVFKIESVRDFVHVDDVCKIHLFLLENSRPELSGIIDVGTGASTSFLDVAKLVAKEELKYQLSGTELKLAQSIGFPCPESASVVLTDLPPNFDLASYQYQSKANRGHLEAIGYTEPLLTIEEGVLHYVSWLESERKKIDSVNDRMYRS